VLKSRKKLKSIVLNNYEQNLIMFTPIIARSPCCDFKGVEMVNLPFHV